MISLNIYQFCGLIWGALFIGFVTGLLVRGKK